MIDEPDLPPTSRWPRTLKWHSFRQFLRSSSLHVCKGLTLTPHRTRVHRSRPDELPHEYEQTRSLLEYLIADSRPVTPSERTRPIPARKLSPPAVAAQPRVDDGIAEPAPETKTEMDKVQAEHLEGTVLFTAPPAVSTTPNSVFLCESPSSTSRDPRR